MMRLVFLLSAEERALLLLGDPRYDSFYAISSLRMQLRADSEEILERRRSAWSRLLALFRGVYGGIDHPTLRLPALGGSLFDPDRYPFLEGRKKGTSWRSDPAEPLPIDDRTVLLLLDAIQTFEGRTLSYRALDVEQIGHVYEGLLERTVKRVDDVTLELDSGAKAKSPRVTLGEIESARLDGPARVPELLKERSERSESAIRNALERAADDRLAARLLTVCRGDVILRDRILPYAPLLRTDPWGYPLVHHKGAFVVVLGADRRESGTHYTPKSLTEKIVEETLTPVAYRGPAEGKAPEDWELKNAEELLDLKICDPAMGSGAFLVQACRWLSDRLVEAWSVTEARGKRIDSEGRIVDAAAAGGFDPLSQDAEERAIVARRLVAERCLYGVDKNPLAVELAKLSLWLTTMSKGRPFGFLDHNLRSGDSLLGIHDLDQLVELDMNPKGKAQLRLFGRTVRSAVERAIELRARLRDIPIRDIHDVEAMAALDTQSRGELTLPTLIADALVGIVLAEERASSRAAKVETLAALVDATTGGDHSAKSRIRKEAATDLARDTSDRNARCPFHWPLEFPEVFSERGFDAIVGNPPYISYYGRDSQATGAGLFERFAERYLSQIEDLEAISGRINTFLLFLVRSIQHSPNAWCAMVLPDTVVTNQSYAAMRLALTRLRRIKHVLQFKGTIFRNATVGTAVVVIGPPTGPEDIRLTVVEEGGNERTFVDRAADVLARTSCSWLATTTQDIRRSSPPQEGTILLSELAHVRDGINPGPKSTRARLLTDRDDGTPTLRRCMEGGWITPFSITVRDLWVHYDQNELSPAEKKAGASLREAWIFDSPKIVYRQTAPRIIAAVDTERMCALNSVHSIVLKVHSDDVLYALLAYLNSSYMLKYYQAATGETRKVFPQVHARSVKSLLVPRVLADADASVTRQLSTLARSISHIGGGSPTKPKDQASKDTVVAQIDKIVEQLIAALWTSSSSGSGGAEALNSQLIEACTGPSTTSEPCEGGRLANAHAAEGAAPSAAVQERTGQSAAGNYGVASGRLNEPARAILSYLQRVPGWHGKADILAYVGMPDGQWNAAINDLLARGIVERQGERRGARYRISESNRPWPI